MTDRPKILLIGPGALGLFYTSRLADKAEIAVAARSDYETASARGGYQILSKQLGDFFFRPRILKAGVKPDFEPDYLFVCLKVTDGLDQPALCAHAVGRNTTIVIIQNGLGNEEPFREAFPENEIISTAAYLGASRPEPGTVLHADGGKLFFGEYPASNPQTAKLQWLADAFNAAKIPTKIVANVQEERWRKLLWNASFNPVSVLGGDADSAVMLSTDNAENLIRRIMLELCAIAESEGIHLTEQAVTDMIEYTRAFAAYKPSMLQDFNANRPLEVESIVGSPVKIARKNGVPAPMLETVYALMKLITRRK